MRVPFTSFCIKCGVEIFTVEMEEGNDIFKNTKHKCSMCEPFDHTIKPFETYSLEEFAGICGISSEEHRAMLDKMEFPWK